jgi:hypothetical protein
MKLEGAMAWKLMWEKTKVMRISRQPTPVAIKISPKPTGEYEVF